MFSYCQCGSQLPCGGHGWLRPREPREETKYDKAFKATERVWKAFGKLEHLAEELQVPLNVSLFNECFRQVEGELFAEIEEED